MDFIQIIDHFKRNPVLSQIHSLNLEGKKKCCVLGNSGSVLESEKGEEIDSMDFIIRNNFGPTKGYEKYVGSKTDLRVVNIHGFVYLYDMEHREKVKEKFPEEDFEFLLKIKNETVVDRHNIGIKSGREVFDSNRNKLLRMSDEFIKLESTLGKNLTTGLVSILIACSLFDEVYIHGFDFYSSNYPEHYFEKSIPYARNSHNLGEEKNIFNTLLEINIIKKI